MTEPPAVQPAMKPKSSRVAKWMISLIAFTMIGCGVWFVGAVNDAREAARNSQCRGNYGQLCLALHNYHETYKCLPPAYIADANGKPMHSWRVLLLPFLDGQELYKQYDFAEPWDGPNNRKLAEKLNYYTWQCPSGAHFGQSSVTNYVAVVGPQTAFPGDRSVTFDDFLDGLENTILLVEIANSDIHWMEPRDLNFDTMSFVTNDPQRPSISAPHANGPAVVFADRISGYRLDRSLRPETVKAMLTIAGGEPVSKDNLIRQVDGFHWRLAEELPAFQ